jgi:hypothetical protein
MIRLADALKLMDRLDPRDKAIPFDLLVLSADRKRNTGGKWMELKGCILAKHNKNLPLHARRVDGFGGSRKPSHYENATRNVQSPDGSVTKVHIRLIKTFNGQTILW